MLAQELRMEAVHRAVAWARQRVGRVQYLQSGLLIFWARTQAGLSCPAPSAKHVLDLFESGVLLDPHEQPEAGDLIFASLPTQQALHFSVRRACDVSHVGLMTGTWDDVGEPTVIHASWCYNGTVMLEGRKDFLGHHEHNFRGYVRLPAAVNAAEVATC